MYVRMYVRKYVNTPYWEVCGLVERLTQLSQEQEVCVCVCVCLCVQVLFTYLRYWFHCGRGRAWWWLLDSFQEAKGLSNNAGYKTDRQTDRQAGRQTDR